jgi:hypothetical protein
MSDKIFVRASNLRPRTPWSIPISVFADYQIDVESKLVECFEFDWASMKIPKMSEEEKEDVKQEMWKLYKIIKDVYRF